MEHLLEERPREEPLQNQNLRESRLGLNPAAAGSSLRIPIPELSEERRVQMVKLVKQLAEEAKVRVRADRSMLRSTSSCTWSDLRR